MSVYVQVFCKLSILYFLEEVSRTNGFENLNYSEYYKSNTVPKLFLSALARNELK